ncbi:MAG TPA: hypothetical protein VEU72_06740 [Nitrosopumilaceae archaeon]|nr:hypothetical protein [Nitrosopumilaceae archaeon]
MYKRKEPSLEEMIKVIETYGIKRETLETSHTTNKDISILYNLIKQKKRQKREQEMIKLLEEYIEKIKKHNKS